MWRGRPIGLTAVAVAALLLAACGAAGTPAPVGRPAQPPLADFSTCRRGTPIPTPSAIPAAGRGNATLTPAELDRRLLEKAWLARDLPSRWATAVGERIDPIRVGGRWRPFGVIQFRPGSQPAGELLTYLVFSTAEEARGYFEAGSLPDFQCMRDVRSVGLPTLSRCMGGVYHDRSAFVGASTCVTYRDNVLIYSLSFGPQYFREADTGEANALTRAGLAHLRRIQQPEPRD